MKILVTGTAGFIGYHLTKRLADKGVEVIGLDNISDYYDINLKHDRLNELGFEKERINERELIVSSKWNNIEFVKMDLVDEKGLNHLFSENGFTHVIHLAAQAGVRYSLENPSSYVNSNLVGFANILECCRHNSIEHLIFASSSSVYGNSSKSPFSEKDNVDNPISLYAATKKSNELLAYAYAHLYKFRTTGLRFFTVYGPWGRPDMAPMLFAGAMIRNLPIKVFNNGDMKRDFTYVDDIVSGIEQTIEFEAKEQPPYKIFNIGNSKPVDLLEFIRFMEKELGVISKKEMMPMQPGDVKITYADTTSLEKNTGYSPNTDLREGLKRFMEWYRAYYNL